MTETKPSDNPVTKAIIEKTASPQDIKNLYVAFLGRRPESPEIPFERSGRPLDDMIAEFSSSAEFLDIIEGVKLGKVQPTKLDAEDIAAASEWLARISGSPSNRSSHNGLLLDILQSPHMFKLDQADFDQNQIVTRLSETVTQEQAALGELATLLQFDAASFSRTTAGRAFTTAPGVVDLTLPLPSCGPAPNVLPLFTDGPLVQNHAPQLTLGDLVQATQKFAAAGLLTHWLWDEATYAENLSRSLSGSEEQLFNTASSGGAYLDFLTNRDRADLSPHPLFSAYAYKTLNPGLDLAGLSPFVHFVRYGQYTNARTSAVFDPDFYLGRHPQVRIAIASGVFGSALEHFIRVGMAAGYAFSPDFDRDYYLTNNGDVGEAMAVGHASSPEWHFVMAGLREGRAPNRFFNPHYYADRYPFADNERAALGIGSLLEHFLLLGVERGAKVSPPLLERPVDIDDAKVLFEKRGRRAYHEALNGVFSITPPQSAATLSIIVPVCGQADFTANFLKCASWAVDMLQFKRGVSTEIIVVDNGSDDHTDALLASQSAVRVVKFDGTVGFPVAVNAGVSASTGEIILVANNDIEFQADAFLRVYDAVIENPRIGVLGAKIILPNETLQEVGSLLDKNGGAFGVGRGLDAVACLGARMIEVDYASGCFIAFNREDYDKLSGFDEAYTPGYYEEVDFSMRMKASLGKSTMVDTGLAITHFEHASFSKGRPPWANEPLVMRNRSRLRITHANTFSTMRFPNQVQAATSARKALNGNSRVLVVQEFLFSTHAIHAAQRSEAVIESLTALGMTCDILALKPSRDFDRHASAEARVFRAWMPGQSLDEVLRQHGATYSHLWVCGSQNLYIAIDAIYAAKRQFGLKVVCDVADPVAATAIGRMRMENGDLQFAHSLTEAEFWDPVQVDLWVAESQAQQQQMKALGLGPVSEITLRAKYDATHALVPFEAREGLLITGFAPDAASPDYEGLQWFLAEVQPLLKKAKGAKLTLSGQWAPHLIAGLRKRFEKVEIEVTTTHSATDKLSPNDHCRLSLAPTRFAVDATSTVQSILMGLPVVMTARTAEQLDLTTPGSFPIADDKDAAAFAQWVDLLYSNQSIWAEQQTLQLNHINSHVSAKSFADQVKAAAAITGMI